MSTALLPSPAELPEIGDLRAELRRRGVAATLDHTKLTRAMYSSDASLYRVVPQAVAYPRSVEEAVAVLEAARADPRWSAPAVPATAYAFAALFYFAICFGMARYAGFIERRLAAGDAR